MKVYIAKDFTDSIKNVEIKNIKKYINKFIFNFKFK